nr:hypothetical protein [Tanacetum cinerariifolium]
PEGFIDADHPSHVYKLKKALYGLKQALRAWCDELSKFLLQNHFFKGTIDPTLFIRRFQDDILVVQDSGFDLTGFSDADYAGCKDTFKSTSDGAQFLGEKLVSWSLKKQDCTTLSTVEAEYVSLSAFCAQVLCMRTQLTDYGFHFNKIPIYCDSKSAIDISCNPVGECVIKGPEMIEVTNAKVVVAKEKLKEDRTRQKSYADKHRRAFEFQPGDHVFLKVSPARGVRRFGIKGKLSPRFIGPFEILDRVGEVSYRLALPPQLSHVHDVFHVSLLRGYKYHPLHVISYLLDQIRIDLSYVEEPKAILDHQDRVMRKKTVPFVKILWRNHPEREATWETEESIRTSYPHFLP